MTSAIRHKNQKSKRFVTKVFTFDCREVRNEVQNHYVVEFLAPYGIGLKLTLTKESELLVTGFNRIENNDRMGPAEACGSIRVGDILAGVNNIILYELGPKIFADRVSTYDHEKTVNRQLINYYMRT